LIEISDVTRSVYISFDAKEQPQVVNVFNLRNFFFALILLLSHHHGAEKFEGGQIALTLIRYC